MDMTLKPIYILCAGILFVMLCQEANSALMCWSCGPCPDPFDKHNVNYTQIMCNGTCMKTVTGFHDLGLYVSRRCSETPLKNECKDTRGQNEVCTCNDKELCNGVPYSRNVSVATVITSLAIFFGVFRLDLHSLFGSVID